MLFIFWLFIFGEDAQAEIVAVDKIVIHCKDDSLCDRYVNYSKSLEGKSLPLEQVAERLRFLLNEVTIESMSYTVFESLGKYYIDLYIVPRKIITDVTITLDEDVNLVGLSKVLPFSKGGVYNDELRGQAKFEIEKYLKEFGLKSNKIDYEVKDESGGININIKISTFGVKRINKIKIQPESLPQIYKKRFLYLQGQAWDKSQYKVELDNLLKELKESGYLEAKIDSKEVVDEKNNKVEIDLVFFLGDRVNLSFYGNKLISQIDLKNETMGALLSASHINEAEIKKILIQKYDDIGIFGTSIASHISSGRDSSNIPIKIFYFYIVEGKKYRLLPLKYNGNEYFSSAYLDELYFKSASDLAISNGYDAKYLEKYISIMKDEYLKRGFGLVKIVKNESIDKKMKEVVAEFKIKEKQQTIMKEISIDGISTDLQTKIKDLLINKENSPLNFIALDQDLKTVLSTIKEEGYYFATIESEEPEKILFFDESYSEARLKLVIKTEKKVILDDILITGNFKTQNNVISRELGIKSGDIVSYSSVNEFRDKLSALGLFSFVKVTPVIISINEQAETYNVNLLVQLKEKDFGIIEAAPGFRSDIGLKLSFGITYNNIAGKNLSNSLRTQLNQRLDYSNLDSRRRSERKKRIESVLENIFTVPYILGIPLRFDLSGSVIRRRYYGFDANIFRTAAQFSKLLTTRLEGTLRYQVEAITQFDATNIKDDRYYRIGSLTPAVTYDRRDSNVNPRSGAFFSLSTEFANPYLLSIHNENLIIDYLKIISRNRFYIPIYHSWTLALALSYGFEENLDKSYYVNSEGKTVRRGLIPSIKVFRLDGVDIVRGYADSEINRLENKRDISEAVIDNKAYFANFKFEPRYNLDDHSVVGVFFDAGRVYKDKFEPQYMKSALGITYKYLTPVGSLDFDYGVKTHRSTDIQDNKESFGRFHLSIGFF